MIPVQCPDDLQLVLVRSQNFPLGVHVLQAQTISVADVGVTFRIIGESHWITVRRADEVWHEVLACVPVPQCPLEFAHAFDRRASCAYTNHGYSVQVMQVPLTAEIARRGQIGAHMEVVFPHPQGGELLPFTRIWWHVAPKQIQWWTIHVYPLERETIAVLSESRYDLQQPAVVDQLHVRATH